jgi:hypothetical protein
MSHPPSQGCRVNLRKITQAADEKRIRLRFPEIPSSQSLCRRAIELITSPSAGSASSCHSQPFSSGGLHGAGINVMDSLFAKFDYRA